MPRPCNQKYLTLFEHYPCSLGMHDDPSNRKMAQISAFFEAAIALLLAACVVAARLGTPRGGPGSSAGTQNPARTGVLTTSC